MDDPSGPPASPPIPCHQCGKPIPGSVFDDERGSELPEGLSLRELAALPLKLGATPGVPLSVDLLVSEPVRLVALAVIHGRDPRPEPPHYGLGLVPMPQGRWPHR